MYSAKEVNYLSYKSNTKVFFLSLSDHPELLCARVCQERE